MAVPGGGCRGEVGYACIRAEQEDPAIRICLDPPLADQHAIPITIETVTLGDRVAVGLKDVLSPGEQQRIALARSLVTEPCILLLDEPLSSLDMRMKASIIEDLRRWTEDQRIPILYVTHDHEEAFALGEHAIALHQGQIAAEGPPREVINAPRHERTRAFLAKVL